MTRVTETHWAEADRKKMADLQAALPEVLSTEHADWQARVDGGPTPYTAHARLYVVRALRYTYVLGVWSPTGEEKTYLVTSKSSSCRATYDAIKRYLTNEFPGTEWAFATSASTLVLDADEQGGA